MGFLTQVCLRMDCFHEFSADPKKFGQTIIDTVNKAMRGGKSVEAGFSFHGNAIMVEPPRHADHKCLFINAGNSFQSIGSYEQDWDNLCRNNPEYAESLINDAQRLLKNAKVRLAEMKEKMKENA